MIRLRIALVYSAVGMCWAMPSFGKDGDRFSIGANPLEPQVTCPTVVPGDFSSATNPFGNRRAGVGIPAARFSANGHGRRGDEVAQGLPMPGPVLSTALDRNVYPGNLGPNVGGLVWPPPVERPNVQSPFTNQYNDYGASPAEQGIPPATAATLSTALPAWVVAGPIPYSPGAPTGVEKPVVVDERAPVQAVRRPVAPSWIFRSGSRGFRGRGCR